MESSFVVTPVSSDAPDSYFAQFALLHQQEIDQGFLSSLGVNFLTRLYRSLACSPHSFVIAAIRGDEVLGFICGATSTAKVYRSFLLSSGVRTMFVLLPRLISFGRIRRIVETLLYPSRNRELELPDAEILNFCVDRKNQRQGIGQRLFAALAGEFHNRGVGHIRIVTGSSQVSAQRFYEALDAVKHAELEVHSGSQSIVYTYAIPSNHQSANHLHAA